MVSRPIGYAHNNTQFIISRQDNGDIQEFGWSPFSIWQTNSLSNFISDPLQVKGTPYGYSHPQGTRHVIGKENDREGNRNPNGLLVELWHSPKTGWHRNNLSKRFGNTTLASDPVGYVDANGNQHIIGRNDHGEILEFWWSPKTGWHFNSITTGSFAAKGNPYGYAQANGNQHVVSRDLNGHVYEFWWSAKNGWQINPLSKNFGDLVFDSDVMGYVHNNGTQHVIGRGKDGNIYEFWWSAKSGWHLNNLSAVIPNLSMIGNPYGYSHPNGTQHIIGRNQDGTIVELWWSGNNGWQKSTLSDRFKKSFATDPMGYVLPSNKSQHIVGIDNNLPSLGLVKEFWSWQQTDGWNNNLIKP